MLNPYRTFFISDYHFDHGNIMTSFHRPFENVKEMNEKLIQNTLDRLTTNDSVLYILGDIGNPDYLVRLVLEAKIDRIHVVCGNHDNYTAFRGLYDCAKNKDDEDRIYRTLHVHEFPIMIGGLWLSHQPIEVMPIECPYLNIHGHLHGVNIQYGTNWSDGRRHFNVAVEMINYCPISLAEIQAALDIHL